MTVARPIVAVLSDFGTANHYAGAMKGAVLAVCGDVTLVDITHDIPAQDVLAGALELAACYQAFPPGTIFLSVVDPGVGSARRGLAAGAGGYYFVAPDNGVLTEVFQTTPPTRVVSLTKVRFRRASVSRTFEGRDRFAPAAGWLAAGTPLEDLGDPIADPVMLSIPDPTDVGGGISGCVLRVDAFGNLVTNISRRHLARLAGAAGVHVAVGGAQIRGIVDTYADVSPGELCALIGSSDRLEIAVNRGSAASRLGVGVAAPVEVVSLSRPVVR